MWLRRHIICRARPEINDIMKNTIKNTDYLVCVKKHKNITEDA